jgi:hypothetical protein
VFAPDVPSAEAGVALVLPLDAGTVCRCGRRGALERIVRWYYRQDSRDIARIALLDDVSQLVREQLRARRRAGRVSVRPEDDVASDRVRARGDGFGRRGGCFVGMYPDAGEVVVEASLHRALHAGVEWTPWPAQDVVDDRRCDVRP